MYVADVAPSRVAFAPVLSEIPVPKVVTVQSGLQAFPTYCSESIRMATYNNPLIQLNRTGSDPIEVPLSEVTPAVLSRSFKVSGHVN